MQPRILAAATAMLSLALLSACATPEGPAIAITQGTNAHFQHYLNQMGAGEHGAFAVSPNGLYSFYTYCYQGNCARAPLDFDALSGCKKLAQTDCLILAHDRTMQRTYRVSDSDVSVVPSSQ